MTLIDLANTIEKKIDRLLGVYNHRAQASHHPDLRALGERYKLTVISEASSQEEEIAFLEPDQRQKNICVEMLTSELSIYQPAVIEASKLEQVVLCSKLHSYGKPVAGLAQMGWFVIDTLFLDVDGISRGWEYARRAFHHELFHAIDYHDDLNRYLDPDWGKLNAQDFKYAADPKGYNQPSQDLGFLSTYGMTSIHEDKAELYCHLVVNYEQVSERMGDDPVLLRKVSRMKEILQRFSPHFDDSFWDSVEQRSKTLLMKNPSKGSQWAEARRVQDYMVDDLPEPEKLPCLILVTEGKENSRRVWKVGLVKDKKSKPKRSRTFYTFNKLLGCLFKLGLDGQYEKDSFLGQGLTLSARVSAETLRRLDLS